MGSPPTRREADIAASTQHVLQTALVAFAQRARRRHDSANLCMAGGVALNCVANSHLIASGPFENIWIQPAAGDDGGAIGAALWASHTIAQTPRTRGTGRDRMGASLLGSSFTRSEITDWLEVNGIPYRVPDDVHTFVTDRLADGEVVGWFNGAMEFGPRALGNRSILADPRDPLMIERLNAAVKQREDFRPFAPAVLADHVSEWFEEDHADPYMLTTSRLRPDRRVEEEGGTKTFADRLMTRRSGLAACTHVDFSARVQSVGPQDNPVFHALISKWFELTGCPALLNTSFNTAGEPIVCSPADAARTAVRARLDLLVLQGCVIDRPAETIPAVVQL